MTRFDFDDMLLLIFVISCAHNTIAGSKKKDLSRFTQSLDLVSVLQQSLQQNNDDYRDSHTGHNDGHTCNKDNHTGDATNTTCGSTTDNIPAINEINSTSDTRRHLHQEYTNSQKTTTTLIDDNRILLDMATSSYESDEKLSNNNSTSEEGETTSEETLSIPHFMQSLEETKVDHINRAAHYRKSNRINIKTSRFKKRARSDQMSITPKDPWSEVLRRKISKSSPAPYLSGKETTSLLAYKVLTAKRERGRRHRVASRPIFVQTELNDTGVVVAAMDVIGPMPDFKLPKERRQYRVDSDDENAEGDSAVSGDNDALVPR